MIEISPDTAPTRRATVPAIERILGEELRVLDRGFVRVVDYMGDDGAIVQAARVSYGAGTKSVRDDENLIRYLMRHRHTTPFEMCEIKLHVKLPIFVARQWIRHRTASVNEYSARYSILDREFYFPELPYLTKKAGENHGAQSNYLFPDMVLNAQSTANRQGRSAGLRDEEARQALDTMKKDAAVAYSHYLDMINEDENGDTLDETRQGLARELARINLPVNIYTQWYWKINLHNLFHFLLLRADQHAQYEIRAYARIILEKAVRPWVPIACRAFEEYALGGARLSAAALAAVRRMIGGEDVRQADSGLGAREWRELTEALGRN